MRARTILLAGVLAITGLLSLSALESRVFFVLTDLQLPGTQPEIAIPESNEDCGACHGGFDPESEMLHQVRGSMMSHSGRDPLFWGQLAVADGDLPGTGNFCIRCHVPVGWLRARGIPSDGSALLDRDASGVQCILCHRMVNPDESEFEAMQVEPFIANDGEDPPEPYLGAGITTLFAGDQKMGPYASSDVDCVHEKAQSKFHRSSDMCGACHDVSNPAIGDLSHNNGAQVPLEPGTFSGVLDSPVEGKAGFNNPPYKYGIIERTFSEHMASAFPELRVKDYPTLPAELRAGAIEEAYKAALLAGKGGDHEDGTPRYFTCQSCHMRPTRSEGCVIPPVKQHKDLPTHDLTGGNYWVPDAIEWLAERNRLRLGNDITPDEITALRAGKQRAFHNLRQAAVLEVDDAAAEVTVINLTGHKLISGYPEGRRMWLNMRWYDAGGALVREDGAYGTLNVQIDGQPVQVESILDLSGANTRIYEVKPAMTQEWANQLLDLGYGGGFVLSYDRITGNPNYRLSDLAGQAPGTHHETFHFILNNAIIADNRIPPYGMRYDEARRRNAMPEPDSQFGDPGPGGVFDHWDTVTMNPPAAAVRGEIRLLYQTTSWEYVQFVREANNHPSEFLAEVGNDLLDSWLATGMSAPALMAEATWVRP